MCTFMTQLPKKSKSTGQTKKKSMVLSLKPCPTDENGKKTWYRVRLLAWTSPEKNDRDYPFIERYVHQVWGKNDKGQPVIEDEVTCPVTKHVHVDGDRYKSCPICSLAEQYYKTLVDSGFKDREASKKNREIGRKFQGIIPVYVRNDPNYPGNKGQVKVIIFSNKAPSKKQLESGDYNKFEYYDLFKKLVETQSQTQCVFNGKGAVDCCFHVSEVPIVVNKGQPNEYIFKQRVIDSIKFSTDPIDLPEITKEKVTTSGFDEEYYSSSTPEELKAFYNRHFNISNDDIPDDDDMPVYESQTAVHEPVINNVVENSSAPKSNDDISDDDIDALTDDLELDTSDSVKPEKTTGAAPTNDADVDELLKDLDI